MPVFPGCQIPQSRLCFHFIGSDIISARSPHRLLTRFTHLVPAINQLYLSFLCFKIGLTRNGLLNVVR